MTTMLLCTLSCCCTKLEDAYEVVLAAKSNGRYVLPSNEDKTEP